MNGVADLPDTSKNRSVPGSRLIALIVACALFMESLDSTVLATALPAVARSLHEDPLHLSLAISSYLVSIAVFIPLSGWMAERFGARLIFRSAIVVFTLGSALCGLSESILQLVGARVLQGLGGAMMVPVGRLVILRKVPKSDLVAAMAWVSIPALVAPIVGPVVGGFIATYSSWRWIFFINVPIGIAGYWLATRYIEETAKETPPPLDFIGWFIVGIGLASFVFGLENLGKGLLPASTVLTWIAFGVLLTVAYAWRSRTAEHPILDLSLLGIPTLGASITGGALFRIGVGAYTIAMPLMLQEGFGLTPLRSGLLTFAGATGALMMRTMATRLVRWFGFRSLLVANTVLSTVLILACGFLQPSTPHLLILSLVLVLGFSRSMQFTCINTMGFADVTPEQMSQASSLSGTAQQLSLSVGVGIAAQILNTSQWLRGADHLAPIDFSVTFWVVGLTAATSGLIFARLAADAGSSVSGHSRPAPT
ncbi:MAG TPA: DHA2 family efflux MFS transporter permease subunit [Steroidobacteraceae bacterium]|nr:DHA2 family efflux MFS transporter permease subunit [Steroidobacteraceae bacterium]